MKSRQRRALIPLLLASSLLFWSCRKAEVNIYDAPKDQATPLNGPIVNNSAGGKIVWQKADHWEELPQTAFRKGNYLYTSENGGSVEITVSSFPGSTGGLLANVNRWLGQASLPQIDQEQLIDLVQKRTLSRGVSAAIVDLNSEADDPSATRIYAATIEYGGQTWFFKMSGPSADVFSQIEAFDEMVAKLEFDPVQVNNQPVASAPKSDTIQFTAPEGWQESEGSSMRIASYRIEKEGFEPADFSITSFPGDTGGLVENVNRWRRQISLPGWTAQQVEKNTYRETNEGGHEFLIFDLKPETDEQRAQTQERILVAILTHNGKSWFFKLRGDAILTDSQRNKFISLLRSVDFTPASE